MAAIGLNVSSAKTNPVVARGRGGSRPVNQPKQRSPEQRPDKNNEGVWKRRYEVTVAAMDDEIVQLQAKIDSMLDSAMAEPDKHEKVDMPGFDLPERIFLNRQTRVDIIRRQPYRPFRFGAAVLAVASCARSMTLTCRAVCVVGALVCAVCSTIVCKTKEIATYTLVGKLRALPEDTVDDRSPDGRIRPFVPGTFARYVVVVERDAGGSSYEAPVSDVILLTPVSELLGTAGMWNRVLSFFGLADVTQDELNKCLSLSLSWARQFNVKGEDFAITQAIMSFLETPRLRAATTSDLVRQYLSSLDRVGLVADRMESDGLDVINGGAFVWECRKMPSTC